MMRDTLFLQREGAEDVVTVSFDNQEIKWVDQIKKHYLDSGYTLLQHVNEELPDPVNKRSWFFKGFWSGIAACTFAVAIEWVVLGIASAQ